MARFQRLPVPRGGAVSGKHIDGLSRSVVEFFLLLAGCLSL